VLAWSIRPALGSRNPPRWFGIAPLSEECGKQASCRRPFKSKGMRFSRRC
jgi:hypothetical protein